MNYTVRHVIIFKSATSMQLSCVIFREEATSALAGFHVGPLSMSNQSLEMLGVFQEGDKLEYSE